MKQQEEHLAQAHLLQFREKVTQARRRAGRQQQELADILGLDAHVLSRKLHGRARSFLAHREVKQIILALAAWDAITTREEAIELLTLMGLKAESFQPQEWRDEPLKRLETTLSTVASRSTRRSPSWPVFLTSYIPRKELEERIRELLIQQDVHLLTLSGTGGAGKTRISLEILPSLEGDFPDGIAFISLENLQDAALLPEVIAEVLDLGNLFHQTQRSTIEQIQQALCYEHRLLVLDNFEHIPEARTFVVDLLNVCPHLKILTTSRRVLNIYGEHVLFIPPFDTIDPASVQSSLNLLQNPAIRLFVERARIVTHGVFNIDQQNLSDIAHICLSLDGLPLAIELAAARCYALTPRLLLDQLRRESNPQQQWENKIDILSSRQQGFQGISKRQLSMQFSLDWSYNLLNEPLQSIFMQLSIFSGNWSLEAAQYVCECPEETLQAAIEELIQQNLLLTLPFGEVGSCTPRFRFSKLIREYALARYMKRPEYENACRRHAHYYLGFAERLEPQIWSQQRTEALQQMTCEQENLHMALQWAIERRDATFAQRLCSLLGVYWESHSLYAEGKRWLEASLTLGQDSTPAAVRAACLLMASRLAIWEMSYQRSRDYAQQALALYEVACDDIGRERAFFQIGDAWHLEGELKIATRYFEECLILQRTIGQQRDYAFTLARLCAIAMLNGDTLYVEEQLREAIAIFRFCGERSGISTLLNYLIMLLLFKGRPTEALPYLQESLKIAQAEGYHYNLALTLTLCGCVLGNIAGPFIAAHLCGAAEMCFEQIGSSFPKGYQTIYRWYLAGIQSQASTQNWDIWWKEGKGLSIQQALELAHQNAALCSPQELRSESITYHL